MMLVVVTIMASTWLLARCSVRFMMLVTMTMVVLLVLVLVTVMTRNSKVLGPILLQYGWTVPEVEIFVDQDGTNHGLRVDLAANVS